MITASVMKELRKGLNGISVKYFSVLAVPQKMVVYRFSQNPLCEIISDQYLGWNCFT